MTQGARVLFRVLGDVSVVFDEGDVGMVVAPRQRTLLASLILNANRVVAPTALVDAIWSDDDRPQHPEAALQVAMSRLRSVLGDAADRIRWEGGGYRLDVGPEETDLTRAEALLRDGRAALALNDARRAAELFDTALTLWTGEALEDLANFPFHAAAARRLHELRITVYEARTDAYLADGRHLEVLADIGEWVEAEPLREHLRAQHIAALYRSGRQADALHECTTLRETLRDTLGIDPSAGIQDLERRVLDQDPTLLGAHSGLSLPLPAWTSETLSFVGRMEETERAMDSLRHACSEGMRLLVVEGEPGVGKSRFLLEFARRVRNDALVLPVDIHESLRPSVVALTHTLKSAAHRMSVEERHLTFGAAPSLGGAFALDQPAEADVLAEGAQWVAALSAKAPVVLLIDDLDAAGPTLLHLIGHLSAIEEPKRVLVVASTRSPIATNAPLLDRLIEALDRKECVDRLPLRALGEEDIDHLLRRMRIGPHRTVATQLHELTGGNAFLLAELLSSGQPERVVNDWTTSPRVRDVVLARVDELGRAASEVLRLAAVFEREFSIPLLCTIFEIRKSAMETVVERALDAQILQASGAHTYRFAHEIARRTLVDELTPAELASAHRRIAITIEREGASAAGLALHWSKAEGSDAPAKTAAHARAAGDDAKRMLEPQVAAKWYELALSYTDHDDRGPLLVDLAEARQQSGNTTYVETLREAARIACDTNDDDLILRVVTSASPGWSTLPGFSTAETRELLARALRIDCDDATRSRVLARHASEQYLDDPAEGDRLAREAILLARRSRDRLALLEALYRHTVMLMTPPTLEERRREIAEALPLAVEARDVIAESFLTGSDAVAAIQAADLRAAQAQIAAANAILERTNLAPLRWSTRTRRVWRTALAGDLAGAEALLIETRDWGCANGIGQAEPAALIQSSMLGWQLSRPVVTTPSDDDGTSLVSQLPGYKHFLARSLADCEATRISARALLVELARHGFADLPLDQFWSSILVATAETAFVLDLPGVARPIRRLLEPYVDQVAFSGLWVIGPIAHGVAVAAAACHDPDADELFERSIEIADRLEAPVFRARTEKLRATRSPISL
jgi:DNA-binding SARP family transcriptional activator